MKCPTHSTRFLAHLLLAAVAISSAVLDEEEVTESYEYDFTTPDLDAYTPRKDVKRPTLDLSDISGEYATEFCMVDGLGTPYGAIAVNCTKSCENVEGDTSLKPLKNGTSCIVISNDEFTDITAHSNISCLLGACIGGNCMGDHNCTWCIKYPKGSIMDPD
ncbi:hypothetical protein MTO96_035872 [Rhipicephalus appendiculatus]